MEIRFLYTSAKSIKKAVTKTGFPLPRINHYITTEGRDYNECYIKAKNECGFNDNQLLGSNYMTILTNNL